MEGTREQCHQQRPAGGWALWRRMCVMLCAASDVIRSLLSR
jgi:hypothetical protein